MRRSICVFCGANAGNDPAYVEAAEALGRACAERGLRVVYGGADVGLMKVVADTALASGAEVVGVLPRGLFEREVAHAGLTELHEVDSMHERKALMADLSDAFVALPGGYGTFEELLEITTWAQLGIHTKPIGVIDVAGYYDALRALFARAVADGFIERRHAGLIVFERSAVALLDRLQL